MTMRRFLAGFIIVVLGGMLFVYGQYQGGYDYLHVTRIMAGFKDRIGRLEQINARLRQENAILVQAAAVDKAAYAVVEVDLRARQDVMLELSKEVAFYRAIVNIGEQPRGLHIQSFQLEKDTDLPAYRYRLILTQYMKSNRIVKGLIRFEIEGLQSGKSVVLKGAALQLSRLSRLGFKFRYFQELDGNFSLPKGFVPARVRVHAIPTGKRRKPVSRSYTWQDGRLSAL